MNVIINPYFRAGLLSNSVGGAEQRIKRLKLILQRTVGEICESLHITVEKQESFKLEDGVWLSLLEMSKVSRMTPFQRLRREYGLASDHLRVLKTNVGANAVKIQHEQSHIKLLQTKAKAIMAAAEGPVHHGDDSDSDSNGLHTEQQLRFTYMFKNCVCCMGIGVSVFCFLFSVLCFFSSSFSYLRGCTCCWSG